MDSVRVVSTEKLKVLSWNIYMLPNMIKPSQKRERAREIVNVVQNSDYDVIVFQEAFLSRARHIIRKGVKQLYPYQVGPANRKLIGLKMHSGVWILSRVPIKKVKDIRFKNCAVADCMARKGATMIEGQKNGKPFQLIGTHVQADDFQGIRNTQFRQIFKELIQPFQKKDVPILISGDLNTPKDDEKSYKEMLEVLQAEDGETSGETEGTYNTTYGTDKDFRKEKPLILDYILIRKNNRFIKHLNRKVQVFRAKKNEKMYLSDHFAVEAEMEL
ncbi:MAG: sphingomyelin phosphodiesterase [Bacteroidia bacterium]